MLPLDLHVLGLPPAFNLSHDQTLQFKIVESLPFNEGSGPNLAQGSNGSQKDPQIFDESLALMFQ